MMIRCSTANHPSLEILSYEQAPGHLFDQFVNVLLFFLLLLWAWSLRFTSLELSLLFKASATLNLLWFVARSSTVALQPCTIPLEYNRAWRCYPHLSKTFECQSRLSCMLYGVGVRLHPLTLASYGVPGRKIWCFPLMKYLLDKKYCF